jgi:hypothetical protein
MIAAIIKTVQTRVLATSDSDPTIATVTYDRWLFIETYLVIVTTSIPSIRSLFRSMDGRKISSTNTHELSSRYGISSLHTSRTRRRDSSLERKGIVDVAESKFSTDGFARMESQNETPESGLSRESVKAYV